MLVIQELFVFRTLFIFSFACVNSLAWWCINEGWFPNMGFLVKQFFGILGSQIEIKCVFSLVGVLIAFRCCRL